LDVLAETKVRKSLLLIEQNEIPDEIQFLERHLENVKRDSYFYVASAAANSSDLSWHQGRDLAIKSQQFVHDEVICYIISFI
jgi:hypothetical protein